MYITQDATKQITHRSWIVVKPFDILFFHCGVWDHDTNQLERAALYLIQGVVLTDNDHWSNCNENCGYGNIMYPYRHQDVMLLKLYKVMIVLCPQSWWCNDSQCCKCIMYPSSHDNRHWTFILITQSEVIENHFYWK